MPTTDFFGNGGLFVFHYGYAVARWYDEWRCKIQEKGLIKCFKESSYFDKNQHLALLLRHQISALIVCLDKIDTKRNEAIKHSTTNVICLEQECLMPPDRRDVADTKKKR